MFDSKIKEIRLKKGMTQEELSHMSNVSQSYISKIENKNCKLMASDDSNKIMQIAKALNCCPSELFVINCNKCIIRKEKEERICCRNKMLKNGHSPKRLILE